MPALELRRPLWGAVAYTAISVGPWATSVACLWGIDERLGPVSWRGAAVALLVLRQCNAFVLSALYHRGASHGQVRFVPWLQRALRLWGWLWTGSGLRTWAIVHRRHHAAADTPDDSHSPNAPTRSFWKVWPRSLGAFRQTAKENTTADRFAHGLPDDALEDFIQGEERRLFGTFGFRLPTALTVLALAYAASGSPWAIAMLAAVASLPSTQGSTLVATILGINGVAHRYGYRHQPVSDASTNVLPVDLFGWGEALHHNHHARPGRLDLAILPWEWDPGAAALRALARLGLCTFPLEQDRIER